MRYVPGRRVYLAASLKLAALIAVPVALFRSAAAQEVQVDTGPDDTARSAELAELRQELEALKAEVKRMNDERSTIKAPFTVVNDANEPIFRMGINSTGQTRAIIGKSGGAVVALGINEGGGPSINLVDSGGTTRARLGASETQGVLSINATDSQIRLGSAGEEGDKSGLFIQKDKASLIELAVEDTGGSIKTFTTDGKSVVELSAAKDTPLAINDHAGKQFFSVVLADDGIGQLTVGNLEANRVEIGQAVGGAGTFVDLIDKGGGGHTMLTRNDSKPAFSASYNDGREYFALGPVEAGGPSQGGPAQMTIGIQDKGRAVIGAVTGAEGSFVSLHDDAGKQRASLTADKTDVPFALFDAESNRVFSVRPAGGEGGPMTLTIGKEDKTRVEIAVVDSDGSYLYLYDPDGKLRTFAGSKSQTGFGMYDAREEPLFTVGEPAAGGPMRLILGQAAKEHLFLGMEKDPDRAVLHLYDPAGKQRASLDTTDDAGMVLYDTEDKPYFTVGNPKAATIIVGDNAKAHARLGVLPSGEGSTIILSDNGGTTRGYIIATEKSTNMNLNDANMRADLGTDLTTEGFAGLTLGKDDKDFAVLHMNPAKGGSVLTANAGGKFVARVGTDPVASGGQFTAAGPNGGEPLIDIWADAEGSKMVMRNPSAEDRVTITALGDDTQIRVKSPSGAAIALDASERAMIELTNAGGDSVVQVFENTSGLGVVRAGPKDSGVAAMLGNQGIAASALLGKK